MSSILVTYNLIIIASLFYNVRFNIKKIKVLGAICISILEAVFSSIFFASNIFPIATYSLSIIAVFPVLNKRTDFGKLLSAQLILISLLLMVWSNGIAFEFIPSDNANYSLIAIIITFLMFIVLNLLLFINKKRNIKFSICYNVDKEIYYHIAGELSIIIMLTVSMMFVISNSNLASLKIIISLFNLSSLIMIIICCLMLKTIYNNRYNTLQKEEALKLLSSQEKYYKTLLEKENETKSFRHDIKNHLNCIRSLCESKKYTDLQAYLDDLNIARYDTYTSIRVGNQLIDVILSDLQSKYSYAAISVFGTFCKDHSISDIDLCIIFSNLLTNAFEAVEHCDDKEVKLHIKTISSNLIFSISNAVSFVPMIINNSIKTTKSGGEHGFGLRNIKECLTKYNGELELKCENNLFTANVIIPNVLK